MKLFMVLFFINGKRKFSNTWFHHYVDALIFATHSVLLNKLDKEFSIHESYSNDNLELDSYNTADTI